MATGMAVATVGMGAYGLYEAKNQADAQKRQAEYEAGQMRFNAQLIDMRAKERNKQADTDVQTRSSEINQMLGSQKASLAAQGISLDSEVAGVISTETRRIGTEDVQAIRNNAWKEVWGMEVQAMDLRSGAEFTTLAGGQQARQTMATGGMQFAQSGISAANIYRKG